MVGLLERLGRRSQRFLILAGLAVLAVIGVIDYLTGYEMLFSVFYLLAVGLAAWFVGRRFGLVTHLYRIAQEAVRNSLQHGEPKRIGITLAERGDLVTLTIEDDGTGLPETAEKADGLGIRIMAHRAAMIGGSFAVEPGPTGGTIVTCSIPKTVSRATK